MNARASTSNPPPKLTKSFVTPPDSSRSQSFASSPIRTFRDGVPPAKRRRLASTPTSSSLSRSTPRSSSSRPEQPPVVDLHDARKASSMRVLNIWSALAERYNRRIDEDDIVDIRTGQVIKDRGVLSELPKRYNFGDLADKEEDLAVHTDPGSEVADNLAGDEDDEDEDDAEEPDAFPSSVSPQIRLAPLRPATSSSDVDDLREFLRAEAIRRELDGGDESSEDEFNILPPRSTPAKRTMTPARKTPFTARAKTRPLKSPTPDSESEDEFAVLDRDRNDIYRGYRARRTPSPEVPASSSPPPPSSSLPPSPLLSHTPFNSSRSSQIEERVGSPTPKRQPLASTSRRTLEDSLNEIDLEFPPPQPRAPSVFGRKPDPPFIIDLSLSDDEAEDEKPHPTVNAMTNSKPLESRTVKKNGPAMVSKRPIPFVLIETKRPTPITVAAKSTSAPVALDLVTSPKKGKPRAKSLKDKPPDFDSPHNPKRGEGSKAKFVKPKPKGKKSSTRLASSDETDSGPSPMERVALLESSPVTKTKAPRNPEVSVNADDGSPPSPPSPSPPPPTRPRIRGTLKRKRRVSSGSSSGEQHGSPTDDRRQQTSPPDGNGIQVGKPRTSEVIDVGGGDHGDGPEAVATGESESQTSTTSPSKTLSEIASAPAPANTIPAGTSSSDGRREDNIQNRPVGSYTYLPAPTPLPPRFPSQTHQPFMPYSGHPPPLQGPTASFNHAPYLNHDHNRYAQGPYPLFQDPNTQALLTRAVTQLAILMNGGQLPQQVGHMGGITGNMPGINGFPGSPGWGTFSAWPPSTPTASRYPYGHDHRQRSFQNPYVAYNQMGGGVGPPMPPPAPFPPTNTFPSSSSRPESVPVVQETRVVQEPEKTTSRARRRSESQRRVTFVLDRGSDDPTETSKREGDGSPPMTRGRSRTQGRGDDGV